MIDRTPDRLVVIAFINLYLGFACDVFGLGFEYSGLGQLLLTLGALVNFSILPLIIIAIVMRLTAPGSRHKGYPPTTSREGEHDRLSG